LSEFHRLIEQQIPRLRHYARALTRNRDRADDLAQDTLGRALIKEQFWQPGTNLASFWIWRNVILRRLSHRRPDTRHRSARQWIFFTNRRQERGG
jgi:RNA polymerase sigma-70 factor, ECF subfamily